MTDSSTPVPSDEAVEAAAHALCAWPTVAVDDREHSTATHMSVDALTAAYAIDAPRLRAEAAAEARAATLREVIAWLRQPQGMGGDSIRRMGDANAIAQEFGIDGDVAL